jgi:Xaa-Pro dipeptidase
MLNKAVTERLAALEREQGLDAVLVAPSLDLEFLMGFSPYLCERFQGLFVKQNGECFYIANLLSREEIAKEAKPDVKVYSWWDGEDYVEAVSHILREEGLEGKVIGTSESVRAFHVLNIMNRFTVKFVSARDLLDETRIHKTKQELDCLRKSAEIADEAFQNALPQIHPGQTERQIGEILFHEMEKLNGEHPGGLICTGENTGYPHYALKGEGRTLQKKDILLMDFGCIYGGFYSDMTRTVFFGEPTEKEKMVYQAVLNANLAGEKAAALGAYIPDVDRAAREIIEKTGYGNTFTTRLGHGIGCKVHEAPDIRQSNLRNLEQGMAFSIEPGIYLPGEFGVRIEDIVVINEEGKREVLNKATKDILVL